MVKLRERDVFQRKAAWVCVAFVKWSRGKFVSQVHLHTCSEVLNVHQFKLDFVRLSSTLISSSFVELNNVWFNINQPAMSLTNRVWDKTARLEDLFIFRMKTEKATRRRAVLLSTCNFVHWNAQTDLICLKSCKDYYYYYHEHHFSVNEGNSSMCCIVSSGLGTKQSAGGILAYLD